MVIAVILNHTMDMPWKEYKSIRHIHVKQFIVAQRLQFFVQSPQAHVLTSPEKKYRVFPNYWLNIDFTQQNKSQEI